MGRRDFVQRTGNSFLYGDKVNPSMSFVGVITTSGIPVDPYSVACWANDACFHWFQHS